MWVSGKSLERAMSIYAWIQNTRCDLTRQFIELAAKEAEGEASVCVGTLSYQSSVENNGVHRDIFRVDLEYNLRVNTDLVMVTVRSDAGTIRLLERMVKTVLPGGIKGRGPGYLKFHTLGITDETYRSVKRARA